MKLYQRGRDENKTWTPETWRSASMYDKVYQNHLAMEAHLQSEGEDKDSSDHDAGGALASKGPELIDVVEPGAQSASDIRGTVVWHEYRGDAHVLTVDIADGATEIIVESRQAAGLDRGAAIGLAFPDPALNVFDAADGRNLLAGMPRP